MKTRILLIEDEPGLVMTLSKRLTSEGYVVTVATDGEEGLRLAQETSFELLLLDIMLPGIDGFEVCRTFRKHDEHTPILMLTARGQTLDKVLGLKLGADDYLTKPFQVAELLARIEALLRRAKSSGGVSTAGAYRFANVEVDVERAEIRKDGEVVELSAKEYQLLSYFIKQRGKVLSRDDLLNHVWGFDALPTTRTVDVHVARLRQKIEPNPRLPQYIVTMHNMGYRFDG